MSPREKIDLQFDKIDNAICKLHHSWKHQVVYDYFDFLKELSNLIYEIKQSNEYLNYNRRIEEYFFLFWGISREIRKMTDPCDFKFELSGINDEYLFKSKAFKEQKSNFKNVIKQIFEDVNKSETQCQQWMNNQKYQDNIETPEKWYNTFDDYVRNKLALKNRILKNQIIEDYLDDIELAELKSNFLKFNTLIKFSVDENSSYANEAKNIIVQIDLVIAFFKTIRKKIISLYTENADVRKTKLNEFDYQITVPLENKRKELLELIEISSNISKKNPTLNNLTCRSLALCYFFLEKSKELFIVNLPGTKTDNLKRIAEEYNFGIGAFRARYYEAMQLNGNFPATKELVEQYQLIIDWLNYNNYPKAKKLAKDELELIKLKL